MTTEIETETEYVIAPRFEPSEWQCELFGMGPDGVVLRPQKGGEPNWFWRWTQYLAFGCKWVKAPTQK